MNKKKSRNLLLVLSMVIAGGSFAPMAYADSESNTSKAAGSKTVESKSKVTTFLEEKRKEKAKEIIENKPESSPLTLESKEEIVRYYADTYMPKKGCSLLDLPADSDIDYVPPKPKPKSKKKSVSKAKPMVHPKQTNQQTSSSHRSPQSQQITKKSPSHTSNGHSISMSSEERIWLERLVEAEATGEPYEGKIGVASVIANRIESSAFPNTVMGVIKAGNERMHQFSPWDDGRIYSISATSSTKKAVAAVFDNGERNVPKETTYFAVKTIAFNNWIGETRKYITTIGNHAFFSQYAK